jgi:hypothetical protein
VEEKSDGKPDRKSEGSLTGEAATSLPSIPRLRLTIHALYLGPELDKTTATSWHNIGTNTMHGPQ